MITDLMVKCLHLLDGKYISYISVIVWQGDTHTPTGNCTQHVQYRLAYKLSTCGRAPCEADNMFCCFFPSHLQLPEAQNIFEGRAERGQRNAITGKQRLPATANLSRVLKSFLTSLPEVRYVCAHLCVRVPNIVRIIVAVPLKLIRLQWSCQAAVASLFSPLQGVSEWLQ